MDQEEALADVEQTAQEFEAHILYRSEAGVFQGSPSVSVADLAEVIEKSRKKASNGDIPEARKLLLTGYSELHKVVLAKSLRWRLLHIHAVDLYLYLAAWTAFLLIMGFYPDKVSKLATWGIPATVLAFGALGGVLRGLWWLTKKVEGRNLRTQFRALYYAAPVLAGILGMLAYLFADILLAGLSVEAGEDGEEELSIGVYALAFLAGFYWEWVVNKIKDFAG